MYIPADSPVGYCVDPSRVFYKEGGRLLTPTHSCCGDTMRSVVIIMNRIKVAQIGIGHAHALGILPRLRKLDDVYDILGVYIPQDEEKFFPEKLKDGSLKDLPRLTLDEILTNPEIKAVFIETDEKYLTHYATLAAMANKSIHMDKPGSFDYDSFYQVVEMAKAHNLIFHLGYMYRYNPVVMDTIEKIKHGYLGEIYSVEAQMSCYMTRENRKHLQELPGGMMFFLGCHIIDLIMRIRGTPDNIVAYNHSTGNDTTKNLDYGFALFEYKNGISFAKTCACEKGGYSRRQLVINGEKGSIWINPLEMFNENGLYSVKHEFLTDDWVGEDKAEISSTYSRYDDMLISFSKMVNGEINNPYSYEYELQLYKVILKCCGYDTQIIK